MSIEILRFAALEWLRYERRCDLVCLERTPLQGDSCTPDVLGVDKARRAVEIEIKRTMADFRANREKRSLQRREFWGNPPYQFYYLVPPKLEAKVLAELQPHEGLLTVTDRSSLYSGLPKVRVVRVAPFNRKARRLSIREISKMVRHQTGTLASALMKLARAEQVKEAAKSC